MSQKVDPIPSPATLELEFSSPFPSPRRRENETSSRSQHLNKKSKRPARTQSDRIPTPAKKVFLVTRSEGTSKQEAQADRNLSDSPGEKMTPDIPNMFAVPSPGSFQPTNSTPQARFYPPAQLPARFPPLTWPYPYPMMYYGANQFGAYPWYNGGMFPFPGGVYPPRNNQ